MAGIMRLEEKHKQLVEMRQRGVAWQAIADQLDVAVSTLHNWWRDPMVATYREHRADELSVRRQVRLVPAAEKLVELLALQVDEHIRQMRSEDPAERLKVPGIKTIVDAILIIHGQERIDSGQPTRTASITETTEKGADGKPVTKRVERTVFERLMDTVVVTDPPPREIDVTPGAEPKESE